MTKECTALVHVPRKRRVVSTEEPHIRTLLLGMVALDMPPGRARDIVDEMLMGEIAARLLPSIGERLFAKITAPEEL